MTDKIIKNINELDFNDPEILMGLVTSSAVDALQKGVHTKPEVVAHIATRIQKVNPSAPVEELLDKVIALGILVQIGDRISLSQQGRLMFDVMSKKIAVAELLGEDAFTVSPDEIQEFRDASEDLPG